MVTEEQTQTNETTNRNLAKEIKLVNSKIIITCWNTYGATKISADKCNFQIFFEKQQLNSDGFAVIAFNDFTDGFVATYCQL